MEAEYFKRNVRAVCPDCGGRSTFLHKDERKEFGHVVVEEHHEYKGKTYNHVSYVLMHCGGCGRGGLAKIHDNGNLYEGALEQFFPFSREQAPLPSGIPDGIVSEFREAELCASFGAWRAASALIRSVLEKTLSANGYVKGTLEKKVDEAATDGVITASRQQRAHDDIRVFGNDILHEEWRSVSEDEYGIAHHYAQRILEDFYDQRNQVEVTLRRAKRIP